MEGELQEQGEIIHRYREEREDAVISRAESDEPREVQDPEEEQGDRVGDGQQEAMVAVMDSDNSPDDLPGSPLPAEEQLTVSSPPSCTHDGPPEPCWYCLRTQESDSRTETGQQEDSDSVSLLPSGGQRLNYQTDPRPHFGVAWSSHSTCRPLWGSEGPCWGQRNQEASDQTHTCPHCHLGMDSDALRWHEAKCLLFDGLRNSK
ncbi:uncharacterized protein isoform X1 [Takifugu rubripes]|uniref:uncharacterized protein isoform X1 n=1 Tax=Takifugu rubripes TaxID=31033 RepID=UPI0011454102|nr:uncharacterized protein LOC115252656 isoform X1 [Takifugu rubripes]